MRVSFSAYHPTSTQGVRSTFVDFTTVRRDARSSDTPLEQLEHELTTLAGHLNAGNYRFLTLLGEFERREGHAGWGIASCAHWLSWKCGIGLVAAREKCRVARALETLPLISDAMRRGTVSYCKVRAITRVATPVNEALLLQIAECGTVTHVEKTVRLFRRAQLARELETANQRHAARSLQCFVDDDGSVVIRARLAPEQGALMIKAIEAATLTLQEAEDDSCEASGQPDRPVDRLAARKADALGLLAETFLAKGAAPLAAGDRHVVTVHVDEVVLRDETAEGRSELEDIAPLPPATIRRLCCDASLVTIVEDGDGEPLNVGRKTRAIPAAMHRALVARDVGCRYPSCTNTRFVDAHHIVHWADGGETSLENLTLLCRRHHRHVHEHGFSIARDGDRKLLFRRPDGRAVHDAPQPKACPSEQGHDELMQAHGSEELEIDENTSIPAWRGENANYERIIEALCAIEDRESREPPELEDLN
jgi:hypothetical protein